MVMEAIVDDAMKAKILKLLDQHRIMRLATVRPDGWPQVTTVGYVNLGLTLYFLCGLNSQKAANLARDDRVSLAIDHDTSPAMQITGLSMAARAHAVVDRAEANQVLRMLPLKYPEHVSLPVKMPRQRMSVYSCDADGHLRARLLLGFWTYRPRHLLSEAQEQPRRS